VVEVVRCDTVRVLWDRHRRGSRRRRGQVGERNDIQAEDGVETK
jgi:hypothetical protein